MREGLPSQATVVGFKAFRVTRIPNSGVKRIGSANSAKIFGEGRRNDLPMGAAIGGQENGSGAANNPAHLIGGSGTAEQVDEDAAGLAGPVGGALLGELDETAAFCAPNDATSRRVTQTRVWNHH